MKSRNLEKEEDLGSCVSEQNRLIYLLLLGSMPVVVVAGEETDYRVV